MKFVFSAFRLFSVGGHVRLRRAQAVLEKAPICTKSVAASSSSTVTPLYCSKAHPKSFLAP